MSRSLDRLISIMAQLRDPERGCPWDRAQDFALLRAADLTLSHGYHYFGIVNEAQGGN